MFFFVYILILCRCKYIHEEFRIQASPSEFWLVSPAEGLVRVELTSDSVRQSELSNLVTSTNRQTSDALLHAGITRGGAHNPLLTFKEIHEIEFNKLKQKFFPSSPPRPNVNKKNHNLNITEEEIETENTIVQESKDTSNTEQQLAIPDPRVEAGVEESSDQRDENYDEVYEDSNGKKSKLEHEKEEKDLADKSMNKLNASEDLTYNFTRASGKKLQNQESVQNANREVSTKRSRNQTKMVHETQGVNLQGAVDSDFDHTHELTGNYHDPNEYNVCSMSPSVEDSHRVVHFASNANTGNLQTEVLSGSPSMVMMNMPSVKLKYFCTAETARLNFGRNNGWRRKKTRGNKRNGIAKMEEQKVGISDSDHTDLCQMDQLNLQAGSEESSRDTSEMSIKPSDEAKIDNCDKFKSNLKIQMHESPFRAKCMSLNHLKVCLSPPCGSPRSASRFD